LRKIDEFLDIKSDEKLEPLKWHVLILIDVEFELMKKKKNEILSRLMLDFDQLKIQNF